MKPEYVHVLLNPLPIYGLGMGVVALALALLTRSKQARLVGLVIVALGALSAWPTLYFGQKAYMPVFMSLEPDAQRWLDVHMLRAERWIYIFYFAAALAVAAIASEWKFPRAAMPLTLAALAAGFASVGVAGWIGLAGGQVRHAEFRKPPPPAVEPHEHHH